MFTKKSFLIVLLLATTILASCEIQRYNDSTSTNSLQTTEVGEYKMRDGVPVLPIPGSIIENDKVDSMLRAVGTSFSEINEKNATKKDLKKNIEKDLKKNIEQLNQLLQNEKVRNDIELLYTYNTMLANVNLTLYTKTHQEEHLLNAKKSLNYAISLLKNKDKYKADLAKAYMTRISIYFLEKKYDKAVTLMKHLIEEFQNIGVGFYKNWFATHQVKWLHNFTRYVKPEKAEQIITYLEFLPTKYQNEVGIAAQIELVEHYYSKDKEYKVRMLSESIKNRLNSVNNPEFKEDQWIPVKNQIKRLQSKQHQSQHAH